MKSVIIKDMGKWSQKFRISLWKAKGVPECTKKCEDSYCSSFMCNIVNFRNSIIWMFWADTGQFTAAVDEQH